MRPVVVDQRHVAVTAAIHERQRLAHRRLGRQGVRPGGHEVVDGGVQVDRLRPTTLSSTSRSVRMPASRRRPATRRQSARAPGWRRCRRPMEVPAGDDDGLATHDVAHALAAQIAAPRARPMRACRSGPGVPPALRPVLVLTARVYPRPPPRSAAAIIARVTTYRRRRRRPHLGQPADRRRASRRCGLSRVACGGAAIAARPDGRDRRRRAAAQRRLRRRHRRRRR